MTEMTEFTSLTQAFSLLSAKIHAIFQKQVNKNVIYTINVDCLHACRQHEQNSQYAVALLRAITYCFEHYGSCSYAAVVEKYCVEHRIATLRTCLCNTDSDITANVVPQVYTARKLLQHLHRYYWSVCGRIQ
jgi:hypothetical protein